MRKKLAIVMLFAIISMFILNSGQTIKYIAENDGIIEWKSYGEEGLV